MCCIFYLVNFIFVTIISVSIFLFSRLLIFFSSAHEAVRKKAHYHFRPRLGSTTPWLLHTPVIPLPVGRAVGRAVGGRSILKAREKGVVFFFLFILCFLSFFYLDLRISLLFFSIICFLLSPVFFLFSPFLVISLRSFTLLPRALAPLTRARPSPSRSSATPPLLTLSGPR